jgi:hypothetical protein
MCFALTCAVVKEWVSRDRREIVAQMDVASRKLGAVKLELKLGET